MRRRAHTVVFIATVICTISPLFVCLKTYNYSHEFCCMHIHLCCVLLINWLLDVIIREVAVGN